MRSRRGGSFSQFGAELGTVGEVRVSSSKDRAEMGSFPLCTVFRGLGQDGESLTRKAKDYSFLLPCSDFVSVRGAGWGEVGGDIRNVRAESLLDGGVECCLLQVGGSSIKVAEGHLGYLGPDHQALS